MTDTFKKKLDVDFQPYKILGACNPQLAYQALQLNADVGLLLPCNVVLNQIEENQVEVSFIDPTIMSSLVTNEKMKPLMEEAKVRLRAALEQLL